MTQIFLSGMIERKRGRIVAICSMAAYASAPMLIVYASTKWGLNGFMKSLNDELLVYNNDKFVKLTTVFPDFMETRKELSEVLDEVNHFLPRLSPEEAADQAVKGILANQKSVNVTHLTPAIYLFLQ